LRNNFNVKKLKNTNNKYIVIITFFIALVSCKNNNNTAFKIENFEVLTNWQTNQKDTIKTILLDYNEALNGFRIPSINQTTNGKFSFSFTITNQHEACEFYYKIYYQNQTYKIEEGKEFDYENFYGSWENTKIGFKLAGEIPKGETMLITDSICIVGNPRNEQIYFENGINNRWKRNPRTGIYEFLLVVVPKAAIEKNYIPDYIQHIEKTKDSLFVNPFTYFLKNKNYSAFLAKQKLKVIAKPNLGNGVYVNPGRFSEEYKKDFFSNNCNNDSSLYKNAAFEIFINYVDPSTRFENIPLIKDIFKEGYSKTDYNWNRVYYKKSELIATSASTTEYPCENVFSNEKENKIIIKNPAATINNWRKESVGIISRHGFTYGKIRVKAKLTELLNKNNMWNGLTNAIWLIYQGGEWNQRRACTDKGYMASYWGGGNDKRAKKIDYSEIDFEILKTVSYCPNHLFPPVYPTPTANFKNTNSWNVQWPEEVIKHDADVIVACTNWDMACPQPQNYGVGCQDIVYNNNVFNNHRWDHNYRALTQKSYANDDELFAAPYYFEIEWRPEEIFWRIGAHPDKMKLVGYMNNTVTSIPNNQMVLIITQEFHNTKWWPGTPYEQHFIPFPAKDYVGEILEVIVE